MRIRLGGSSSPTVPQELTQEKKPMILDSLGCGGSRVHARSNSYRVARWCSEDVVRVEVSTEAEEFVRGQGGQLWGWPAHPRVCCWGTPAYMHAATEPPRDLHGFSPAHTAGLQVWYRIPGGRRPDVLEIGVRGKRRPHVEAY